MLINFFCEIIKEVKMDMLFPAIAAGAVGLAVLVWIFGGEKESQKAGPPNERPIPKPRAAVGAMGVPGVKPVGPPPAPEPSYVCNQEL